MASETPSKTRLTIHLTLWLLVGNAISIAAIIVGAMRIDMCPIQPKVPVYLIVAGSLGVAISLFQAAYFILAMRDLDTDSTDKCFVYIHIILTLVSFGWFIAGCVWVFKVWKPDYDPTSGAEYCDEGLYLFAFVSLIIQCITQGRKCCCG